MFRPTRQTRLSLAAAVLGAVMLFFAAPARGDEVELMLERLGLKQLLALHLEERLESLSGEQRQQESMRLARLYAELLETVEDPVLRKTIEERSRALLRAAPEDSVDELRLALLRSAFRTAEEVAEQQRMRLSTPEEVEEATETLRQVIPELKALEDRLENQMEKADKKLGRSSGSDSIHLADELERLANLETECGFLRAWALYYQSWLNSRADNARVAQRIFAEMLDAQNPFLEPADVSTDLRSVEAVARSILGLALCKSLTASTPTAITWVRLLEHEGTFEAVRAQVPAWRMFIHLENGEYRAARSVLNEYLQTGEEVPLAWLRLVAVYALEAPEDSREKRDLIGYAVTQLASRAELEQILDLAKRYGAESLGDSGFALYYVRGVLAYHEARELHGDDRPRRDAALVSAYREAIVNFRAGLDEPDANQYVDAAIASQRLVAWCLYFQSDFRAAKQAFQLAAKALPTSEASEALWMSIVCQEKLVHASGTPGVVAELAAMIDQYLEAYPSSEHAPKLLLKQALTTDNPTIEMIEGLLAIPESSSVHQAARRRAAHLLYGMARRAKGADRAELASRYLGVAVPIIMEDDARLEELDEVELQRLTSRCRRVVETALDGDVLRTDAARVGLEIVDVLQEDSRLNMTEMRVEFDYRRIKLMLVLGDLRGAEDLAEIVWQREPGESWARLTAQTLFRHAHDRWRAASGADDDRGAVDWVITWGERLIGDLPPAELRAAPKGVFSYVAAVAEAHMLKWERSQLTESGRRALTLYRDVLLETYPRNIPYLRSTAVLSEQHGSLDDALDCWRRLVGGLPMTDDGYFEAKLHQLQILAVRDEDRARQVLKQHRTLHPDYGPDPYGRQIRGIELRLNPNSGADETGSDGDDPGNDGGSLERGGDP